MTRATDAVNAGAAGDGRARRARGGDPCRGAAQAMIDLRGYAALLPDGQTTVEGVTSVVSIDA